MAAIINDVLDFARGRLGGGLPLKLTKESLEPCLRQIIEELQAIYPARKIEATFDLQEPVSVDRDRVGQLFSNLLANALTYGPSNEPIEVRAKSAQDSFEVSVSNKGTPIPADIQARLFLPFVRGAHADQVAKAHGGTLSVNPPSRLRNIRLKNQPTRPVRALLDTTSGTCWRSAWWRLWLSWEVFGSRSSGGKSPQGRPKDSI